MIHRPEPNERHALEICASILRQAAQEIAELIRPRLVAGS
jgi:hypothetical protein